MSEGNWSIETDEDAVWLVKAALKDVDNRQEKLLQEMTDTKKKLLNIQCNCCNGLPADEDEAVKCQQRLKDIDAALSKLAEKRTYFEALHHRCESKQWDDEPE